MFVTMELHEVSSLCLGLHVVALRSMLLRMPGSGDDTGATGKRKKKSVRGSRQQGTLWKELAQGHIYLSVHPAAVLSPQLCLEATPVLTGTDHSVPVMQNLGVQKQACAHHPTVSKAADEARLQTVNHLCFSLPLRKYFGSEEQRSLGNNGSLSGRHSCT